MTQMKAITLINPAGQSKEFTNVEFFDILTQFANSKAFARWSEEKYISGWVLHGKEQRLSISAVKKFLIESGYQIIDNLHDESLQQ